MRPKQFPKEDDVSASSLRNSLGGCCWSSPRVRAWDIDVKIVSAAPTAFQKRSQMWDWSHFSPSQIPWVVEPHQDALHAPQNGRLCAMSYRIYIKAEAKNVWWNWRKLKHCTFKAFMDEIWGFGLVCTPGYMVKNPHYIYYEIAVRVILTFDKLRLDVWYFHCMTTQ